MVRYTNYLLLLPGIITCGFYLVAPLVIMLMISFYKPVYPVYEPGFTPVNYINFLTSPQAPTILINTFSTTLLAAVISLILGYPFAYFLTFKIKSQKMKTYLISLLMAPFLIDWTTKSVAWIAILGESGLLNSTLISMKAIKEPLQFLFRRETLYIIWVQTNLLFMIFPIHLALNRVAPDLINAAKVLKAPPHRVFYDIIFKLSLPGVICGFIFVFVSTLGDYATPMLWAGGIQVLGLSVSSYAGNFLWPQASALGIILLVIALVVLYILLKVVNIKKLFYE